MDRGDFSQKSHVNISESKTLFLRLLLLIQLMLSGAFDYRFKNDIMSTKIMLNMIYVLIISYMVNNVKTFL